MHATTLATLSGPGEWRRSSSDYEPAVPEPRFATLLQAIDELKRQIRGLRHLLDGVAMQALPDCSDLRIRIVDQRSVRLCVRLAVEFGASCEPVAGLMVHDVVHHFARLGASLDDQLFELV